MTPARLRDVTSIEPVQYDGFPGDWYVCVTTAAETRWHYGPYRSEWAARQLVVILRQRYTYERRWATDTDPAPQSFTRTEVSPLKHMPKISRAFVALAFAVALALPAAAPAMACAAPANCPGEFDPADNVQWLDGGFTAGAVVADADTDGFSNDIDTGNYTETASSTPYVHTNRAGRPITNSSTDWCQGIAYGRVNNHLVLFTAAHCYIDTQNTNCVHQGGGHYDGTVAYNNVPGSRVLEVPTGMLVGTIGSIPCDAAVRDLGFIYLASGVHPLGVTSDPLNRVYRDTSGGVDRWRNVTAAWPTSASCDDLFTTGDSSGRTIYQYFQNSLTTTAGIRTGSTQGFGFYSGSSLRCTVKTSITYHVGKKDSGSSFVFSTGNVTPLFVGSYRWGANVDKLVVTPLYHSMRWLNDYWKGHGGQYGAWFCYNYACTGNPN